MNGVHSMQSEDYHQEYLDKVPQRLLPQPLDRREAAG